MKESRVTCPRCDSDVDMTAARAVGGSWFEFDLSCKDSTLHREPTVAEWLKECDGRMREVLAKTPGFASCPGCSLMFQDVMSNDGVVYASKTFEGEGDHE